MCIRDSHQTVSRVINGVERVNPETRQKVEAAIAELGYSPNAIAPVSYTHLRAHETVLDLVCRLLLEKQKNKQTHTHTYHIRKNTE